VSIRRAAGENGNRQLISVVSDAGRQSFRTYRAPGTRKYVKYFKPNKTARKSFDLFLSDPFAVGENIARRLGTKRPTRRYRLHFCRRIFASYLRFGVTTSDTHRTRARPTLLLLLLLLFGGTDDGSRISFSGRRKTFFRFYCNGTRRRFGVFLLFFFYRRLKFNPSLYIRAHAPTIKKDKSSGTYL